MTTKEGVIMSWSWVALMPHPPILVPEVGRGREREADATLDGLFLLLDRIFESPAPDRILLLSPHQPYAPGALSINGARRVRGSLASFGAGEVAFDLRTPPDDTKTLADFLAERKTPVRLHESHDLSRDQGSLVPLYFLEKRLGRLPPVILANAVGLEAEEAFEAGRALAEFDDGRRWAMVASGDLSHRLRPGAPAGYSPSGAIFDEAVQKALLSCDASVLKEMPARTREEAGECGLRSVMVMLGLCSALGGGIDVLSYEGPFGVGYCNAVWTKE